MITKLFSVFFKKNSLDKPTFFRVANEFLDVKKELWCEGHHSIIRSQIDRYLNPSLGEIAITEIDAQMILPILHKIERDGHYHTAHRVLGVLNQIFRFGIASGYITINPSKDLSGAIKTQKISHRSALVKPYEIGKLLLAIETSNLREVVKLALFFCAYNFCRSSELRNATWREVNFKTKEWKIPAVRMKMRKEHTIPLSNQSLEILSRIKEMHLSEKYIFPDISGSKAMGPNTLLNAIKSLGYDSSVMTIHGFRSTASTVLNEKGFSSDIIEKALAHTSKETVRFIYNRAQWKRQRRKMMQAYADILDHYKDNAKKRMRRRLQKIAKQDIAE